MLSQFLSMSRPKLARNSSPRPPQGLEHLPDVAASAVVPWCMLHVFFPKCSFACVCPPSRRLRLADSAPTSASSVFGYVFVKLRILGGDGYTVQKRNKAKRSLPLLSTNFPGNVVGILSIRASLRVFSLLRLSALPKMRVVGEIVDSR